MNSVYLNCLNEHRKLFETMDEHRILVDEITTICADALRKKKKIMFCGNGGSAADAQHLSAELVGRFTIDRAALAGLALTTDTSALTCIANDYSFDDVFARQVQAFGNEGDVLIGISTSGNSENVLRAVKIANDLNIQTVLFGGGAGGKIREYAKISLLVKSNNTARIQEGHIFIGHAVCQGVEKKLFGGNFDV